MDCFVDGTRRTAPFCADRGRDSARREVGLVSSNGRFRCLGGIRNPLPVSRRDSPRTRFLRRHCGVRGVPFGSRPPTLASARSHKRGSFPARSCCCMQRRRDTSRHGGLGPRDRILRPGAYRDLRPARTSTPPLARPIDVIDAARRVLHSRCVVRGRAPPRRGGTRHPCRDGHGCKGSHTTPRSLPPAAPAHDSGTKQNA